MISFSQYLKEAVAYKNFKNALSTIESYLEKKLGKMYKVKDLEYFEKSDGTSGFGVRYFLQNNNSIRFNWDEVHHKAVEVNSIDLWVSKKKQPDFTIETINTPINVLIQNLVNVIKNPDIGTIKLKLKESISILNEAKIEIDGQTYASKNEAIQALLKSGITDVAEISNKFDGQVSYGTIKYNADILKINLSSSVRVTKAKKENAHFEEETEVETKFKIPYEDQIDDIRSLVKMITKKTYYSLLITGKAGVGKSHVVEEVLTDELGTEGKHWILFKANITPASMYAEMVKHNGKILLFDDADAIFKSDLGRNILKAALDSKPKRKVSWATRGPNMFDPEGMSEEEILEQLKNDKLPSYFYFTGAVIVISNLNSSAADPDGAIRSRSIIVDVQPDKNELIAYMEKKILPNINKEIPLEERKEVFNFLVQSPRADLTIRKLVRAFEIKASGSKDWQRLVQYYA